MLRVGSYVWHHERRDPETIARIFRDCDVILLQRVPKKYTVYFGDCFYIDNWQDHGMLVKGGKNVTLHELPENHVTPNFSQGKYIPVLDLGHCKIVSCLTSYEIPSSNRQLEFVMELADDNTVISGDMHWEDSYINNLYKKYQLINHMEYETFTGRRGELLSLDKILTRVAGIRITDVKVHNELAKNNIEHYPYEFTLHVK